MTNGDIRACRMVGDVNMFFKPEDKEVECEVMIAGQTSSRHLFNSQLISATEPSYRRKGLAIAALRLLLRYAKSPPLFVEPSHLVARVGASNNASISLFNRLGFLQSKYVAAFNEVELRFGWDNMRDEAGDGDISLWGTGMIDQRDFA
jgi:RimJ/RimL family protein N-acetyltransferase